MRVTGAGHILNLNNYDYIEKSATGNPKLQSYEAIAKIMKVYFYQGLVDVYGNVPYTQALTDSNRYSETGI